MARAVLVRVGVWVENLNIRFLGSSMVEHSAVNRNVVGSSPTRGAKLFLGENVGLLLNTPESRPSDRIVLGLPQIRGESQQRLFADRD